jgi:NAD(P)-dependent dehydrogenase (short-subunit alcohol dehydrogenase family)
MRVLVTGAGSGIGLETVRLLGERGDDVALVGRGRAGLERAAELVRGRSVVAVADVTDADAVTAAVDAAVGAFGGLDAVIVNAGAAAYGELREMPLDDARRTIDVTLVGAINLIVAALPELERSSGTIVATGSVAGLQPQPLMAAYAAAKHGLRGLLGSLRLELRAARSPVRVAMVHPGPVDTPFWTNVTPSGPMPPELPAAYRPQTIARALVEALERPRPERTVGIAMRAALVVRALARPASDLGLTLAARWALSHAASVVPGRALREPVGEGRVTAPPVP